MEIFVYHKDADHIEEGFPIEKLSALLAEKENLVWVDMEQPTEADNKILADIFHFHPLTIEDAIETRNHPIVRDKYFYVVHCSLFIVHCSLLMINC